MDVGLREAPCVSCVSFRVSSTNYYLVLVSRFTKYMRCAVLFSAISALLTTENSDDLKIRVPDKSRSLAVTPADSSHITSC